MTLGLAFEAAGFCQVNQDERCNALGVELIQDDCNKTIGGLLTENMIGDVYIGQILMCKMDFHHKGITRAPL